MDIIRHGTDDRNILIVEDDEALRERLAKAMEKRGFAVRSVAGVAEAKTCIDADPPAYAVVDLRLLDGDGLSVVEALEHARPDARGIILTGYGDIPTAIAAVRMGAVDYLAKPATADEIVDTLMAPRGGHPPAPENPTQPDEARLEHIQYVFAQEGGNVSQAARLLNMHRRTLQRILNRNGLSTDAA